MIDIYIIFYYNSVGSHWHYKSLFNIKDIHAIKKLLNTFSLFKFKTFFKLLNNLILKLINSKWQNQCVECQK